MYMRLEYNLFLSCAAVFTLKYYVSLVKEVLTFVFKFAQQFRLYFITCTEFHTYMFSNIDSPYSPKLSVIRFSVIKAAHLSKVL